MDRLYNTTNQPGTGSDSLTNQVKRWGILGRATSEAAYARRRDVGNVRNRAPSCSRDLHLHRGCAGSSLISYPSMAQRGPWIRCACAFAPLVSRDLDPEPSRRPFLAV